MGTTESIVDIGGLVMQALRIDRLEATPCCTTERFVKDVPLPAPTLEVSCFCTLLLTYSESESGRCSEQLARAAYERLGDGPHALFPRDRKRG